VELYQLKRPTELLARIVFFPAHEPRIAWVRSQCGLAAEQRFVPTVKINVGLFGTVTDIRRNTFALCPQWKKSKNLQPPDNCLR